MKLAIIISFYHFVACLPFFFECWGLKKILKNRGWLLPPVATHMKLASNFELAELFDQTFGSFLKCFDGWIAPFGTFLYQLSISVYVSFMGNIFGSD